MQEGFTQMFRSIGVASALILSSLLAAPFAMAEESPAFVARNAAVHASFEQHEEALAAKASQQDKVQQASTFNPQGENAKHT